jgi:hypothetical protein
MMIVGQGFQGGAGVLLSGVLVAVTLYCTKDQGTYKVGACGS